EQECRERDMTYARPLFVTARFMNAATGEIKEQTVFMGDFPMMTDRGTFIINGTERIVVSQLVRSPGVYFGISPDKTSPEKDHTENAEAAFIDIYRKLRPGEPPTPDSARGLLENLFFNPKRYDMAKVGRHKVSKKLLDEYPKLGLERFDLKPPKDKEFTLSRADILATVSYLVKLHNNDPEYYPDDIDHFGNRRVRSVGELIQNQVRVGLS